MNNGWTYFTAQRWAKDQLVGSEVDPSAPQFLLEQRHNWDATHLLLHNRDQMPVQEQTWFKTAVTKLLNHVPAQYIVGKTSFYGREFRVTPDVLVPEAETAELVDWVLEVFPDQRPLRVLDLGTGSGVIGITLALERPQWAVTLSDISPAALAVARGNATHYQLELPIVESDLFDRLVGQRYDLIVTNPPYIDPADTAAMDQAVLENEPALALFADEHGLGFYHRLFQTVGQHLTSGGQLFGETGYDQEESIQALLARCDQQAQVAVRHDVAGKMRMIHAWDFSGTGGN